MGLAAFKQVTAIALALCAMFVHVPRAKAQTPEGDPSNAATWYRAAYAEYKGVQFEMDLYDHVSAFETNPDGGPSTEARKYLRQYRETIRLAKRAAMREFCDFGPFDPLDDNASFHVASMRTIAGMLRVDYLLRVFDGDVNEAINDLRDGFRIARHAATQRGVLPVLVGAALLTFADNLVKHAIDHGLIGPSEAARLLRELDKFKGDDPLGMRDAIIAEQLNYRTLLSRRYTGDDGVQRFRDDHLPYYRQEEDQPAIAELVSISREDVDRLLKTLRLLADRVIAALHEPDPAAMLKSLETIDRELKDGRHGRFARSYLGYSAGAFEQIERARKTLDDRIAMLQGIADGTIDPLSLANAACWYIRAGVKIEQVDPAALALIDAAAAQHDSAAPPNAPVTEALTRDDVREVLQLLATAARIKRCDFSYAEDHVTYTHRPYHAGLLACGRLLAADATRLLHDHLQDEAIDRLAQAWRMSASLAGDGCVAGSLAAHQIFNDADSIVVTLIERGALPPSQINVLSGTLGLFSRGDPFHYQSAINSMREKLGGWFVWYVQGAPSIVPRANGRVPSPDQNSFDEAQAIVAQCSADQVMSLLVGSEGRYMVNGVTRTPPQASIEGLWPIVDVEAMQRARELTPILLQWARMRAIAGVSQANLPVIAPIEARAKQSIEDFRACVRRLEGMGADSPASAPATSRD